MTATKLALTATDAVAKALHIDDDIAALEALGEIARDFATLRSELAAQQITVASVAELLDKLSAAAQDAKLASAFNKAGLSKAHAALVQWIGKITRAAGTIPPEYKHLLSPLSALVSPAGKVSWSVTTAQATPDFPADQKGYQLNLGLAASVSLDASVAWPDATPPDRLLRIGVAGKIEAGARAALPFAYGSASGAVGGSAALALDYYFAAADQSELYAAAVVKRLPDLPSPFDLNAVWDRFADTDLEGIVLNFGDTADARFEVVVSGVQALDRGVTIDAGLKVGVVASHKGAYTLTLRRDGTAGALALQVDLTRRRADLRGLDTNFGLTVDLSALVEPVAKIVQRLMADWNPLFNELKPFLTPGTWLRDYTQGELKTAVGSLIDDDALKTAVIADMETLLGIGARDASSVEAWLTDQVSSAIDRASVLAKTPVDQLVTTALGNLNQSVPSLSKLIPADELKAFLGKQVDEVLKALEDKVTTLFKRDATAFNNALNAARGEVISGVNAANLAFEPVRDLLNHYNDVFQKVLGEVEKAAKRKVTARIYRQEVRTREAEVRVTGKLLDKTTTGLVFETLTRGSLQDVERLAIGSLAAPGFQLGAGSKVSRVSGFKSEEGVEIAFVNMLLTTKQVMSGKAAVTLNANGDVEVEVEGAFAKDLWIPWNKRGTFFADTFRIVEAAALARTRTVAPALELGFGAVFHDEKLSWSDVEAFVRDLDSASLLPAGTLDAAKAAFAGWSPGGGKIAGDLSAAVRPRGGAIETLLRLTDREKTTTGPGELGLSERAQLDIIGMGLEAAIATKAIKKDRFEQGAGLALNYFTDRHEKLTSSQVVLYYWDKISKGRRPADGGTVPGARWPRYEGLSSRFITMNDDGLNGYVGDNKDAYRRFFDDATALRGLVRLIDVMGGVYQSVAAAGDAPGWTEDQYRDAEARLAKDAKLWLTVFHDAWSLRHADVTPRALALMRVMTDLSGRSATTPGGAVLTMTHRPSAGSAQTVSFG